MRPPLPHQVPVLAWALPRDQIGLFLEMRLGKSYLTVQWAKAKLAVDDLALVVAPTSVLPGWQDELVADGIESVWLTGGSDRKRKTLTEGLDRGVRWFLTNPEALRSAPDLCDYDWQLAVLDESTFIANPQAQLTKILNRRLRPRLRAILTGTPAPESDLQYFEQMRWLTGSLLGFDKFWPFRQRAFYQVGFDYLPKTGVKDRIAAEVAEACYVLSAADAGIPNERIYEIRYCDLPPGVRGSYRKANKELALGDLMTRWVPVAQTWMAQLAGGTYPDGVREGLTKKFSPHKFVELERLLDGELHGKPVVVFFRFNREIFIAKKRLLAKGLRVGSFTGLDKPEARKAIIQRFQRGQTDVLLAQGKAARFGLDFHRASAAIFFSNWWDWQTRSQLEARIRHPSRQEPALYVDICTRGTVDEAATKALREKSRSSSGLLRRIRELHEQLQRRSK